MHLQPEVRVATEQLIQDGRIPDPGSLNAAELIFCAGFFLVYTVEEVVHSLLESHRSEDEEAILLRRTVSIRRCGGPQSASSDLPVRTTGSTQVLVKTESPQPPGESLPNPASVTRSVRGLVALVALSFHAVFEGLAVGLERSPTQVKYQYKYKFFLTTITDSLCKYSKY
jgi:zinc transporter 1/2/3